MTHPVCFSQSAPTQSPPQHITATQWVFSRQWGQIGVSNMRVCIIGVVEDFLTQGPSTNPQVIVDDDIFPFVCDIQRCLLYKKSSSSAWCRDTRSPWVEIRQKGILCYTERHTQPNLLESTLTSSFGLNFHFVYLNEQIWDEGSDSNLEPDLHLWNTPRTYSEWIRWKHQSFILMCVYILDCRGCRKKLQQSCGEKLKLNQLFGQTQHDITLWWPIT